MLSRTVAFVLVAWLAGALPLIASSGALAADGDSDAMNAQGAAGEGDPTKIRDLRELLREAEREQALRRGRESDAARNNAVVGTFPPSPPSPPSPLVPTDDAAADAGATPTALTSDATGAATPEDLAAATDLEDPAAAAPRSVERPGCMYSGSRLIWERKPGICH